MVHRWQVARVGRGGRWEFFLSVVLIQKHGDLGILVAAGNTSGAN
jgi:hypothetical protein